MPDFILYLPLETITIIVSYLNQNECIESTIVSKRWFQLIPKCLSRSWYNVDISPSNPLLQSNLAINCLGPHVKKVTINCQDTCRVLDTLDRRKCHIKSLDITGHKVTVKRKGRLTSNDSIKLPMAIGMFSSTLTELLIDCHPCDVSIPMLLDILPSLTHLTVKFDDIDNTTLSNAEIRSRYYQNNNSRGKKIIATSSHTNLIFLCLDNALNFDTRILPVLQRCPKLKFLLIALDMDRTNVFDIPAKYIHNAFELCPLIRYIAWNGDPEKDRVEEWLELSRKYDGRRRRRQQQQQRQHNIMNSSNRRSIKYYEDDDPIDKEEPGTVRKIVFACNTSQDMNHLVPIMIKSRLWLEHLYISVVYDWFWDFLPSHHFPQLTTLELYGIAMSSQQWVQLISHHPQIEHLETEIYVDEMNGLDRIVEAMGTGLKNLRHLLLQYERSNPFMPMTCITLGSMHNTHIQHLHLASVSISDQAFYDICGLHHLEELCIGAFDTYREEVTEAGLLAGVKRWIDGYTQEEIGQDGCKKVTRMKSKIRFIQLTAIQSVTDSVLESLGQVESLMTLRITYNESITDDGPRAFGNNNNSNNGSTNNSNMSREDNDGNRKKLEMYACYGISRRNPFVTRLPD